MGDIQEIVVFTLPILLIGIVVLGLCCTFCCYMLRSHRRNRAFNLSTSSDVEQPRRPFPCGLKKAKYKSKWLKKTVLKDDMCTICLEDFKQREDIVLCKCQHAYHYKCMMKWLEIKETCPICQRRVHQKTTERTPLLNPQLLEV